MARPLPFSYRITLQGSFSWPRALSKPPQPCEMLILPPEGAPRAWQEQVQKSPTTNSCSTCQGSRVVGKDVTLAWAPRPLPRQPPPPPKSTCTSAGGFQSRSALCSTVTGCAGHVQSSPNRAICPVSAWWSITPSAAAQGWSLPGAPGDCSSCVRSLQPS